MNRTNTLFTGATGLLGQFLMCDALARGWPVCVLARRTKTSSAAERLERLLSVHERRLGRRLARPRILIGDLGQSGLGLGPEDFDWLSRRTARVIHCAAVVTFRADGQGEPYATNVDGTARLLELCQQSGLREFHHVSTAYVCPPGATAMESSATLTRAFANDYERSKALAENLVRQSAFLKKRAIYRPSIIVGDSRTGYTSHFQAAYPLLRLAVASATQPGGVSRLQSELDVRPEAGVNLVPVDWVSEAILHLIDIDRGEDAIYHLTNPHETTFLELAEAVKRCLQSGLESPPLDGESSTSLVRTYGHYLREHPRFDRSQTVQAGAPDCPRMHGQTLERMVAYALRRHFQPDLDPSLRERMERLPLSENQQPELALIVPGPDGGSWGLASRPTLCRTDRVGNVVAYCHSSALIALLREELTTTQALWSGGLVLEGEPAGFDNVLALLGQLLEQLRGSM
jgi:thioester reductase-like protein